MYKRIINLKETLGRKSLFLLGPRQTGKSTYLKTAYPNALYINLLKNSEFKLYSKNPEKIQDVVKYFIENSDQRIVIIDEVQRLPDLLNEVHDLIEFDKSLRFILTGSSARKLKRGGANLLGGRASLYHMYPICYPELDSKDVKKWTQRFLIGALPSIINSKNPLSDLKDYVGLYLREEVLAEGLTRSIENFSRFLDFAALINAEQVNFTAIGSDAQISPSTVRDYFEILSDTLIGHTLPAFLSTKKRKAMSTGKFYLFDCGVVNSIIGRKDITQGTPEYGKMMEQAVFIELKTYLDYKKSDKKLEYWRSTSQFEVDFLVYSSLNDIVAIEVKGGANPSKKDFKGILALEEEFPLLRKLIVCNAELPQKIKKGIEIVSLQLKHLDFSLLQKPNHE
jgi:predicted AAA+ superfamily ATPase